MAFTLSPDWTRNIDPGAFSVLTPADGADTELEIDIEAGGYDMIRVFLNIDYGGGAAGYIDVEAFASYDGGTNFSTGYTYQRRWNLITDPDTFDFPLKGLDYVKIVVTNETGVALADIEARYNGRKWVTS